MALGEVISVLHLGRAQSSSSLAHMELSSPSFTQILLWEPSSESSPPGTRVGPSNFLACHGLFIRSNEDIYGLMV